MGQNRRYLLAPLRDWNPAKLFTIVEYAKPDYPDIITNISEGKGHQIISRSISYMLRALQMMLSYLFALIGEFLII